MLTAMLAAENILGANHDLWEVNADQEYHEEALDREGMRESDRTVIRAFARFDKLGLAISTGTVCGVIVLAATLWLALKNNGGMTEIMQLLNQYFFGYSVTVKGAFVGMGYTFLWGFLFGWLFAYLHNLLVGLYLYRVKRKLELFSFREFTWGLHSECLTFTNFSNVFRCLRKPKKPISPVQTNTNIVLLWSSAEGFALVTWPLFFSSF